MTTLTTASITLAWYPVIETGGIPIVGFKLYGSNILNETKVYYDGTNHPEILNYTIQNLPLNQNMQFYITALNPYES